MKPAPFEYFAPNTRAAALALLAAHGGAAKALAGGQSLVPTMNFRLAQPAILVDLNGIADLAGLARRDDGGLVIGAMTRQRAVERSPLVAAAAPLIAEAMPYIAHSQIRNRGTFGGSLAHADPAAELPAVAVALDMTMEVQGVAGGRQVAAGDFFQGLFTTALAPDELLVAVHVPPLAPRTGTAFGEVARRHGDYAMAGAAAVVTLAADGTVAAARLVFFAIGDAPIVLVTDALALAGAPPSAAAIGAAVRVAVAGLDPPTDIHATAAYRRHLAASLARQTLSRAVDRARSASV